MSKRTKDTDVPGFWDGFMAMFGHKASYDTPHTTDTEAMRGDWEAVGRDLYMGINENEHLTKKRKSPGAGRAPGRRDI